MLKFESNIIEKSKLRYLEDLCKLNTGNDPVAIRPFVFSFVPDGTDNFKDIGKWLTRYTPVTRVNFTPFITATVTIVSGTPDLAETWTNAYSGLVLNGLNIEDGVLSAYLSAGNLDDFDDSLSFIGGSSGAEITLSDLENNSSTYLGPVDGGSWTGDLVQTFDTNTVNAYAYVTGDLGAFEPGAFSTTGLAKDYVVGYATSTDAAVIKTTRNVFFYGNIYMGPQKPYDQSGYYSQLNTYQAVNGDLNSLVPGPTLYFGKMSSLKFDMNRYYENVMVNAIDVLCEGDQPCPVSFTFSGYLVYF